MTKDFWQELLPIDGYTVISNGLLHEYDRKPLTFLYQPLIGSTCLSLYMTLWSQLEENKLSSSPYTHHMLMSVMDLNLKSIYKARLTLEGIGLLKTYSEEDNGVRTLYYELQRPLSPEQFFLDGMLNVFLFSKIGEKHFTRLRQFFSDEKQPITENVKNITKKFDEVFSSAGFEHSQTIYDEQIKSTSEQRLIGEKTSKHIEVEKSDFDFELLLASVRDSLVPRRAFTKEVKAAINRIAFLYRIDPLNMANIIIGTVDENNEINIAQLRKAARDWYKFENEDKLPVLVDKVQPPLQRTQLEEPKTKEQQLIQYLETTSPRQLLIDLSGGGTPSMADLKIVEDIMFDQKLQPGVVNVLLQYVMLRTDMKLTRSYIEKIASHWARKKVSTVKEAMEVAISEHRRYTKWAQSAKSEQRTRPRTTGRTEKLPDWFVNRGAHSEKLPEDETPDIDFEAEKRRLEKKFKK